MDQRRNRDGNRQVLAVAESREPDARRVEEAMEEDSLRCKYPINEERNNPFKLITPIILNNRKLIAKIDTGSSMTCINKYILDSTFDNTIKINKVKGSLNFLSRDKNNKDIKAQRIGMTEPMTIKYSNNISFEHEFEVVEFNSVMETEFDILLGTDVLPRMRIGLTGVAHCYPKDTNKEEAQFENMNFDTKNNYDPENATYGTQADQDKFMHHIKDSIEQNKLIKAGSFCTMKESIVHIPIKKDASNCYVRQYPLPYHARPEIEKQLQEWLDTGVVVECEPSAKHNTPLLAIPKRDANNNFTKHRIVMDLRRCNLNIDEQNIQDFAVPNIKDIFDEVTAKGKVFTKLDLKNAYHSFKVADASQEVLSFTVNNKTYKWVGCCFGLKFVTSLYCRVINLLFQGMEGVQTYVDDCCIYSDPEDHAALVKKAIDRLTSVNLKINFEKCTWFKTSIYILGFTVGAGIRKIDTRRLSNLDAWKTPKNSADVRKLMGFITYLHEFIPMISKVAAPINALRHCKDSEFKWTPLHTERFQTLKDIILSDAVLHTPRMDRKFYLETDSSLYATAAALTQRDEHGRTLHIAFVSKAFDKHQLQWSTNRKETYGVVYGFEKFRALLWGHPEIEVRTDHRSLVYMQTSTTLCRTLQNYMEVLNDFNFTVVHLKGINNILPDTLSRVYPPIPEDKTLLGDEEKKIMKLERCILQRRLPNDKINKVVNNMSERFIHKRKVYSTDKDLNILAVRLNSNTFKESTTDYIAPPNEERDKLLREAHLMGHFGSESIVQRIHEDGMHWHGIYDESKEIVRSCIDCARHNIAKKGYHPLRPIVSSDPFTHIAMDLAGPFSVTQNQNIYIFVIVDLCTKYIIARPIPNKQSDTIASTLCQVFGDYGLPVRCQSDNARDYLNGLMTTVTRTLGIDHRFSTPYHPRGNGAAENAVKIIVNTVRKLCGNDTSRWDELLPAAQLCCNYKIRNRTGSSPFSLMFARQLNKPQDYTDPKISKTVPRKLTSEEELINKAEIMATVVFPAIHERTMRLVEEQSKKFNTKHYLIDIAVGTAVMVKLPNRASKLSPLYEGPFTVVRKTQAGTYVLKDEMNELLHRDYVPSELKVVSIDETNIEDELYEVQEIRDHRQDPNGEREYLVKWVGYGERENSWLKTSAFSSPQSIKAYWDKVRDLEKLEKIRKAELVNKSDSNSKTQRLVSQRNVGDNATNYNKRKRTNNTYSNGQPVQKRRSSSRLNKNK